MSLPALEQSGALVAPFGRDYWRAVAAEVWGDRLIHGLILAYAVGVALIAFLVGAPERLNYLGYAGPWLQVLAALALGAIVVAEVPASIRADPARPLARLKSRLPELLNPRVGAAAILILGLIVTQGAFTSAKNLLPSLAPFTWDPVFAELDATIHAGRDPWRWLQPLMGHEPVTRGVQVLYTGGWLLVLCGVTAALAASRRLSHLRARFFLTYLFAWVVLGNVLAGVFMSAGPVYFGEVTGDAARFADQMRYLSFSEGALHSSFDIQKNLWAAHELGRSELGSGISAFPSLHIAMATLFMLAGFSVNRWLGAAAAAFLAVILAGSVHLAWHYAVDGYASFVAVAAVWFGIAALERVMTRAASAKYRGHRGPSVRLRETAECRSKASVR